MTLYGFPREWDEDEPPVRHDLSDRLCRLVFIDGVLVDVDRGPVQGSGYECAALELEAQRRPREVERPVPAWERELSRLDASVGGREALLALTAAPLEQRSIPAECAAAAGQLDALDLGDEFTVAVRNALVAVFEASPGHIGGAPEQVAAAITWVVARANGMTGAARRLRQGDLCRLFEVKQFPTTLAGHMTYQLQRFMPESGAPLWSRPPRNDLGLPDVLLSSVRSRIVRERDRALAARERARRDEEARGA